MPAYDQALFNPPAPIAHVTLKNPVTGLTSGVIPMLLDSGADVTMVPEEAARALGVDANNGQQYELVGLEGTSTLVVAVGLELRFLQRTFRGQFLLTRHDYGILGRNVMNNVSLVFNGPRLVWEEKTAGEATE